MSRADLSLCEQVRQQAGARSSLLAVTLATARYLLIYKKSFDKHKYLSVLPIRREGTQGFFKGMLYPLLSSGAINSLFFGFYGATLNQLPVRFYEAIYGDILKSQILQSYICMNQISG